VPFPIYRFELMDLTDINVKEVSAVGDEVMVRGRDATSRGLPVIVRQALPRTVLHSGEIDFKSNPIFNARGKRWH
jgi:hypothetical protein